LGTKETIEDFGVIGALTHKFTLTNTTKNNAWYGYLTPTLFSIPNTGFDEEIEINGISDIEALKYYYYDNTTEAF
jgi:hypothetical protein